MGPGDLDKRITIQYETKAPDGYGSFAITWADLGTFWAKRTPHRSNEAVQAMKLTGKLTVNWRIRYRRKITAIMSAMRVKYGNVYGAIVGPPIEVDEGGGRHWLDITVEETR